MALADKVATEGAGAVSDEAGTALDAGTQRLVESCDAEVAPNEDDSCATALLEGVLPDADDDTLKFPVVGLAAGKLYPANLTTLYPTTPSTAATTLCTKL